MNELMEIRNRALVDVRKIVAENTDKISAAYHWIIRLSHKAVHDGLLALEEEVGYMPKDMLLCNEVGYMVEMVTWGTAPEFLEEWMTLKYIGGDYTGIQGLLFFLYARAILLIQAGEQPYRIEELFDAVLPADILSFDRQSKIRADERMQRVEKVKTLLSDEEKECLQKISNYFGDLSADEWIMLIKKRGFYGFDKVIPYLDEKTQLLVKEHMNDSRYYNIMRYPMVIKEKEFPQIEAEIEDAIMTLRQKTEPSGLLDGVLYRNDEEMKDLIHALMEEFDDNTLTLIVALRGESKKVKDKFLNNMSLRLKYEIEDDAEYVVIVRLCDVEDAQRSIRRIAEEKLGWNWQER
jgi:hypothetical protein